MKERKKRILPIAFASVLIPLILCIEAPLEIFSSNYDEFLFSLSDFLPILILIAVAVAALIGVVLFVLPKKAYRICYMLTVATALLFFLQENYMNAGYSSLAGDNLAVSEVSTATKVINLLIWIAVEAGAVVAACFWKKTDFIKLTAVVLSLVAFGTQFIGILTVSISDSRIGLTKTEYKQLQDPDYKDMYTSVENLTHISSTQNIFYFCIDRFDELYAEDAYELHPEIFDFLDGFTWFQDNISIYGHTFPAVANMLTDIEYDCSTERTAYLDSCYNAETPLSILDDLGYEINIYSDRYYSYTEECYLPEFID